MTRSLRNSEKKPKPVTNWDQIKALPVELFQTLRGPVIGYTQRGIHPQYCRVWAPAYISFTKQDTVQYVPIAFCESYFNMYFNTLFGTNPVPEAVEIGYLDYAEEFIKGSYNLRVVETEKKEETSLTATADNATVKDGEITSEQV